MPFGDKARQVMDNIFHGSGRPREDDDARHPSMSRRRSTTRGRQAIAPPAPASPTSAQSNTVTHRQHDEDMATVLHRPITPTHLSRRSQSKARPKDPERNEEEYQVDHSASRAPHPYGESTHKEIGTHSPHSRVPTPTHRRIDAAVEKQDERDTSSDLVEPDEAYSYHARVDTQLHAEIERLQSELKEVHASRKDLWVRYKKKRHDMAKLVEKITKQAEQNLSQQESLALWQKHYSKLEAASHKLQERTSRLEHASLQDKQNINNLMKEQEQAAANRLTVDAFDSSVDRVSEAQLLGAAGSINSSIDDFVSNVLEDVSTVTHANPSISSDASMLDDGDEPLLIHAVLQTPGNEAWGLLLECLLHQKAVEFIHKVAFSRLFGVSIPVGKEGERLTAMHSIVSKNQKWKLAQRWRAVTADALYAMVPEASRTSAIEDFTREVQACLATASRRPVEAFDHIHDTMKARLTKIVNSARVLSLASATDMLSVRIEAVLGTDEGGSKEILWPEMGWKEGDEEIASYSFGLVKIDEKGRISVLLKPKVVTQALIRYVDETSK